MGSQHVERRGPCAAVPPRLVIVLFSGHGMQSDNTLRDDLAETNTEAHDMFAVLEWLVRLQNGMISNGNSIGTIRG